MKYEYKIIKTKRLELYFTNLYKRWNKGNEFIFITPILHLERDFNKNEKSITLYLSWIFFTLEFSYYLKRKY